MNVNGTNSLRLSQPSYQVGATQAVPTAPTPSVSGPIDGDGDSDGSPGRSSLAASVSISQDAQVYSKLQQLQQQNPAQFQQVMTTIAGQLQSVAQQQGAGTQVGQFLSGLAGKFQQVASGGSLSLLQPASDGRTRNHHRAHNGGTQSASNQAASQQYWAAANATASAGTSAVATANPQSGAGSLFSTIAGDISQTVAGL